MELLYVLALLACPVGMGAMMWLMSKGMMGNTKKQDSEPMRADSLQQLREQQHRLSADIARLEEHQEPDRAAEPAVQR